MATQHRQQHDQNKNGGLKGTGSVIVIMVPFSLQSHMNQLLQLSCLISSYNVPVHYLGSTFCNSQVRNRVHGGSNPVDQYLSKIHFHDFPIPPYVYEDEDGSDSNSSDNFLPCFHVTEHLRQPFFALLQQLSSKARRVVIIHDVLTSSAVQDARSVANAESYTFNCASAFNIFSHYWEEMGKPSQIGGHEISIPINNLYLPSVLEGLTPESIRKMDHEYQFLGSRSGELYNTSRSIEGNFLGLLSKLTETTISNEKKINIWAMGPLNPVTISSKVSSTGRRDKCLEWLDNQKPNSVMYICFGTTISMTNDQIEQVAVGLEQSGTKFIWVFRDADKGDHCTRARACCRSPSLPQGFEERVEGEGMGMVVRGWAPQPQILGHPSTGGFMSHCGWNSCMESIGMGVPIAAWPMHSDQPRNAILITLLLKVGVSVGDWDQIAKKQLVSSSMISKSVRTLMASDEGDEMRKRAADLGAALRTSTGEGGVSRMEWDSFVKHILRS